MVNGTDCIGSYKSNYYAIRTAPRFNKKIFKKETTIRVIFFLCGGCDILFLIFLFWIAKLKRLLLFVIFLYKINTNILGLQLSENWDVYSGRSTLKLMKLKLQGPLSRMSPWNKCFNELTFNKINGVFFIVFVIQMRLF